jgi:hypothetical protein
MLIDLNCMLSICCKPKMLITLNTAKTWFKGFGASNCRQVSPLSTWSLCMSRSRLLCRVRAFLLSVVTQALLVDLLCVGDLSLSISVSLSLLVMPMAVISGRSRLSGAGLRTGTHRRCRLSRKVFTSRARWMSLHPSSECFHANILSSKTPSASLYHKL